MGAAALRRLAGVAALALLGGCAPEYLPVDASGARTALPASPASAVISRALTTGLGPDPCGATALAYLVGKPRTEIPVAADLKHRRVVCTGCEASGPRRLDRQTITFDPVSGRVVAVVCE